MTESLQNAFAQASLLPAEEQELLASRVLAELAADTEFDRVIAASPDKLAKLATEALNDHRLGKTKELRFETE